MDRVVVFSPSGDPALAVAEVVGGWTAARLGGLGHEVTVFSGPEAERPALDGAPGHGGLAIFAHGDEWTVLGHSRAPALDDANLRLGSGLWVWAFACRTGVELGPRAVEAGARAWAGFEVGLHVAWTPEEVPEELRADLVELTSEPACQFAGGCLDPAAIHLRVRELGERILGALDDVERWPDLIGLQFTVQQMVERLRIRLPADRPEG